MHISGEAKRKAPIAEFSRQLTRSNDEDMLVDLDTAGHGRRHVVQDYQTGLRRLKSRLISPVQVMS